MKLFKVIEVVLLLLPSRALAQLFESSLVYHDSNARLVYESDEKGNRIVDFSNVGYKGGLVPLPQIAVAVTIPGPVSGGGDNTALIQNAIDQVAALTPNASGHRGAVLLKKGIYPVSGVITIHTSGIVLRGEGQGTADTVIRGTGTSQMEGLGVVVVASSSSLTTPPIETGTTQLITNEIVPVGSRTFSVENGSMYNVGDRLLIQHRATTAWLEAVKYGQTAGDPNWDTVDDDYTMKFQGFVTAIVGNKIKLDSPLKSELRSSLSQATVSRHSGAGVISECGVENLRVVSYTTSTNSENESHRKDCIHFINVRDCWAFSSTAAGFVRAGFLFTNSIRSTVLDCSALDPVSTIQGERRHNFRVYTDSHDILFKGCTSSKSRHDFLVSGAATTSGIVYTRCYASGSYTASENHRRWGSAVLWDNIWFNDPDSTLTNSLALGHNRGNYGASHGWTGSGMVGWNVTAKKIVVQQGPNGQNYAIACKGIVNNEGPWTFPLGFVEGTNQMPLITSLYEAQLAERKNHGVGPDAPAKLSVTTSFVLSWHDIALDEDSYVIERSDDGTTYTNLANLPASSTSYTDTTASAGAVYTYRVKAMNYIGSSAYSKTISSNEQPSTSKPSSKPTTGKPTPVPSSTPTTGKPTDIPTSVPSATPTTGNPTVSSKPTASPTTGAPVSAPTNAPTKAPTMAPTRTPTKFPTNATTKAPTSKPTTRQPTTKKPTPPPTRKPTKP